LKEGLRYSHGAADALVPYPLDCLEVVWGRR